MSLPTPFSSSSSPFQALGEPKPLLGVWGSPCVLFVSAALTHVDPFTTFNIYTKVTAPPCFFFFRSSFALGCGRFVFWCLVLGVGVLGWSVFGWVFWSVLVLRLPLFCILSLVCTREAATPVDRPTPFCCGFPPPPPKTFLANFLFVELISGGLPNNSVTWSPDIIPGDLTSMGLPESLAGSQRSMK